MTGADSSDAALPADEGRRGASLRLQAVANAAGNLAFYAVIFLLTPLAIRKLGSEGWGIWQLVGATTAYASLLSLGLGSAIHYQVAYNVARKDIPRLASAFTNARVYLAGAGILLLLLLLVAGDPLMRSLVAPAQREAANAALFLTLGITALTLPLRVYPSALAGLQRLDLNGLFQLAAAALLTLAVWLGFAAGMDLRGFCLVMTLGAVFSSLPCWIVAHRLLPRGCLRFTRIDWPLFRELLQYSVNTLAYVAGTVVLYQTMKFIAAWRCGGAVAAGEVGLAISIVQTLGVVFVPIFTTLLSRFGQLHGSGRSREMSALLLRALTITGLLLVPCSAFLWWDAREIFEAWVGKELAAASVDELVLTTRLMLVGQTAYVFALPCYYALLGVGEHRPFGISMLCAALANAGLGWIAAGISPRIASLAVAFGIVTTALAALVTLPAALRRFEVSLPKVIRVALLLPLGVILPGLVALSWKPIHVAPLADLVIDAALFSACVLPGLEWARRRQLGPTG